MKVGVNYINLHSSVTSEPIMKYLFIVISTIFFATISYGQNIVSAEFSTITTLEDPIQTKRNLDDQGVNVTYQHIELDQKGFLKRLIIESEVKTSPKIVYEHTELLDFGTNGKIFLIVDFKEDGEVEIDMSVAKPK